MQTTHYGVFDAPRFAGLAPEAERTREDDGLLRREERDAAILGGKLPHHEQDHDRHDELSLASWLALMNF